jgi:hypothetical protein
VESGKWIEESGKQVERFDSDSDTEFHGARKIEQARTQNERTRNIQTTRGTNLDSHPPQAA